MEPTDYFITHLITAHTLLYLLNGVTCQRMAISTSLSYQTHCTEGLIAGQDILTLNGTVDSSGVALQIWRYIDVHIRDNKEGKYTPVAFVDLLACRNTLGLGSFCVEKGAGQFNVIFNETATDEYSDADIKLMWKSANADKPVESVSHHIRAIYGEGKEQLTMNVSGSVMHLASTPCSLSASTKNGDKLVYCCSSSLSPCVVEIKNGDDTVAKGSTCVTTVASAGTSFTLSHSVCDVKSSRVYNCDWRSNTEGGSSDSDNSEAVIGGAVGGSALLVAIIIGIVIYRRRKRKCPGSPGMNQTQVRRSSVSRTPERYRHVQLVALPTMITATEHLWER